MILGLKNMSARCFNESMSRVRTHFVNRRVCLHRVIASCFLGIPRIVRLLTVAAAAAAVTTALLRIADKAHSAREDAYRQRTILQQHTLLT